MIESEEGSVREKASVSEEEGVSEEGSESEKGVKVGDGMRTIISDISMSISRHVLQWIPNVSLCFCTG